ncbi:CehA/McbA family metallohydrolase [Rosettibacter firmus]|uniref:CehA/McbA family metallohydrolase n=1 Tax=Rosettibacter firmus TaxID=3111522 RepID=UPI00336C0071
MFEYTGAIHVHSIFSDGSGDIKEITQSANESGLDFVILTDHNTLRALHEGYEGWYGNTFLLVGCEINDKENRNHLLALNINEAYSTRLPAKEYVHKVKEAGGLGFIAHPHEKRNSMEKHPPYPWTEWDTDEFTGIEIWNHMSVWMESLTEENKYNYFVHPLRSITPPPKETLEVWDKLNLERKVVGIGGVDAHAHKVNLLGFFEVEVFPYKVMFKSIRTNILLDEEINPSCDILKTKRLIYDALKEGRCFVNNYYYGDAKGFRFYAFDDKNIFQMGDTIPHSHELKLKVIIPGSNAEIRLIRNGELVTKQIASELEFMVMEIGAYRVEVYLNENAWIFSNHIRIGL